MLESIKEKIYFNQCGGLRGTSTTHALVVILQNWHNIIHTNKTVRILYIDFRKAFDSINHVILLDMFRELGVHPVLIPWLHIFLYQRQQRVKIGDEVSSWLTVKGAVLQGSWLGPLCFQHIKAQLFGDQATAADILASNDPAVAKRLSYNISGFNQDIWTTKRHDLMLQIMKAKFHQNLELRATGKKNHC